MLFFQQITCYKAHAQYTVPVDLSRIYNTQGNLQLGPLRLHPLFAISEIYDSNIFDTPDNEESDLITMYSPGINLFLPIRGMKSEFSASYLANFLEYRENSEQGRMDQYVEGSWKTILPRGLGITLHDRFEDTEIPPTFDYIYGVLNQRTSRRSNYFNTTVTLPDYFARFDSELSYSNNDHQYDAFENSSYNEQKIGTRLTYKLLTKLDTLTELNFGKTNYDTNVISDSVFYESLVGVQWKETAKTTGIFKVGYRARDYDEEEFEPFDGVVFSLESKTQLDALTNFSILLRRSQEETFQPATKGFYDLNSLYITFSRKLTGKIEASLANYYQVIDYPAMQGETSDTEYFTWGVRPSIDYKIQKWLFAKLSYWYEDRDSSSDDSEDRGRKKQVITFTLGATF
ncbi:capsular polysaccharide synthesis enzyme CpsB [Candidatus Brocadia pituitae]|nr:capsular polysaccharide synthesis enzyme CpsB [Candidatus Brocadia pituitae]